MKSISSLAYFRKSFQVVIVLFLSLISLFLILEAGLFCIGATSRYIRDRRNRQAFTDGNHYKIVCFGESMTFLSYPKVLEKMLNKKYPERKFSVIDEGLSRTRSNYIVNIFDSVMDREKPQAVVILTGCGDEHVDGLFDRSEFENNKYPFLYRLRSVRLFVLLRPMVLATWSHFFPSKETRAKVRSSAKYEIGNFDYAALSDKCWDPVHVLLGQGKQEEALHLFEDIYKKYPDRVDLRKDYRFIVEKIYLPVRAFIEAQKIADEMFLLVDNGKIEEEWAWVAFDLWMFIEFSYFKTHMQSQRAKTFVAEKQKKYPAFAERMFFLLEESLLSVEAIPPDSLDDGGEWMCGESVWRLLSLNKKDLLKTKLLSYLNLLLRDNDNQTEIANVFGALGVFYLNQGNEQKAREFFLKAKTLRNENIMRMTCLNIRFLARRAIERGLLPIFVQYPVRSIEPLEEILEPFGDKVVIVSNEDSFKDGILKHGYCCYFEDSFAWDFGHMTDVGKELISKNIMSALEQRLQNK